MRRRLIGLLLAVLLAGIATFFLVRFVTTADERAREAEAQAQVFVAQGEIEAGTPAADAIGQGLIVRDTIPARTVPVGAIGDLEQLTGLVATGPIFDGEVIVAQRFGSTAATPAGLFDVPEGLQAVTIQADVVPGLAGFIEANSLVSLVASLNLPDDAAAPPDDEDADADSPAVGAVVPGGFTTQYVVQNVQVLAVGQRVVSTGEDGQVSRSVQESNDTYLFTLAMTPEDIERVVFTTQQGTLWFTLMPALEDDEEPQDFETPGRTIENVLD